jgi:hypothetical protein
MGMKALLNKAGFSKRSGTPIYELVYVLVLNLAFFEPRNFSN